jgi:tetratricopeptide (TPR) repeat protein
MPVEEPDDAPDELDDGSVESDLPPGDEEDGESEMPSGADSAGQDSEDGPSVFCNQCGWENPPGARYCSRCGEALQDLSEATPSGTRRVSADLPTGSASEESTDEEETNIPPDQEPDDSETDEQAAMGRQIVLVVGGALVLVLGLFFVTQWSNQYEWSEDSGSSAPSAQAGAGGGEPSSEAERPMSRSGRQDQRPAPTDLQTLLDQTADSLTGPVAGRIDSLQTRIDQASSAEKRQLQTELVNLYIGAGHPGRAAVVQEEVAEATGSVDAQRRAADLLYRWMQKVQGQGQRQQVFQVAQHAARAYETVADQRPDDLDARTRMGEAYLLTNEPMKGIKAINGVLDEDSTFVPARFQKGLALLQINRLDQATKQFEMVRQYAEDGSPFSQQAERAIKVIEEQRTQSTSGGSPPSPGANR